MHIRIKRQCLNILESMQKLQDRLSCKPSGEEKNLILENCQKAALTVGEQIEKGVVEDGRLIPLLEEYCELVYGVYVMEEAHGADYGKLDVKLAEIRSHLEALPSRYRVVFLPYKADMWDSLESIWKSCSEDENCECDVVPIPYYEFNRIENKMEPHYDGDRFPSYVPVVHYDYYHLEEMKPDVAYIHNPYDDCNFVTSVHPAFYSSELKKNVGRLVYVPYYANVGAISKGQSRLPVYFNMDYMVVQSQNAKESCRGSFYYDRLLPFGSPKFDKVIYKCKTREAVWIPEGWKEALAGKKSLMLNTTINDLLKYGEELISKLMYLFKMSKGCEGIVIVWRPHPLLEATIKSLRPHLLDGYKNLVEYFEGEKIGILDRTGDVSNTIAVVDGYIGSRGSSVVVLFEAAGKPIFLFDNMLRKKVSDAEKRRVSFLASCVIDGRAYAIADEWGGLFSIEDGGVRLLGRDNEESKWFTPYYSIAQNDGRLYFAPFRATHTSAWDEEKRSFVDLDAPYSDMDLKFVKVVATGDKMYYLPFVECVMLEYNVTNREWKRSVDCMTALWKGMERKPGAVIVKDGAYAAGKLWITTGTTNRVLQYNVERGDFIVHSIGENERGFSHIVADDKGLWLADAASGDIVRWLWNRRTTVYRRPQNLECWGDCNGIVDAYGSLQDVGKYIIATPHFSNGCVRLDKETGKADMIACDFYQCGNKYIPTGLFGARLDESHVLLQRKSDDAMAVVNVYDDTFEMFYPELNDEDFAALTDGEDGFEKPGKLEYFCRHESRLFELDDFLVDIRDGRLEDVKKRQLEETSSLAANLDGSCGSKVHRYMMEVLNRDYGME